MRILLINPNSSESMCPVILEAARRAAGAGTELSVTYVKESPALINSDKDELEAAFWTMQKAKSEAGKADALVIACHSDPGIAAIAEATGLPVVGIGYASMSAASESRGPVAVLVISEKSAPRKVRLAKRYGLDFDFDCVATGYTEEMAPEEVTELLLEKCREALKRRPYSAFVLGCAGMSSAAPSLRVRLPGVEIIDGTEEAVRILEERYL